MSYHIRLLPGGKEFEAAATESVLEGALHSGLNLPYNCSSGTCGMCKARLVEGRLGETRFHDYSFSDSERQQGYFLTCSATPGSDLTIEIDEVGGAHAIAYQRIATHVAKIERIGDDYLILLLRTPRTQTLQFLAGQHVQLSIADHVPCDMALASCPCNGMYLQFHLARQPDVPFVRHVFERLAVNDVVKVEGPYGRFVLDERSRRPLVLIAEDTGFAPIKSLMEHVIALESEQSVRLLWFAADDDGLYMTNLCRSWEDALDNFCFAPVSRGGARAALAAVCAGVADIREADLYISATPPVSAYLLRSLLEYGVPAERLFVMEKRRCGVERS